MCIIYISSYMHPESKPTQRGSGQPRGHSRRQVVSPGSSRPNEESIQPSAHSGKAGGGTLIPAPKVHADARRPCVQPRTQFGNPSTPIGSQGPFWAAGQAPPIHRGDEHRGRASFMPSRGIYIYIYICIYIYIYNLIYMRVQISVVLMLSPMSLSMSSPQEWGQGFVWKYIQVQ